MLDNAREKRLAAQARMLAVLPVVVSKPRQVVEAKPSRCFFPRSSKVPLIIAQTAARCPTAPPLGSFVIHSADGAASVVELPKL